MKYLILLFPVFALAKECDVASTVQTLRPEAEWTLKGNNYRTINWLDKKSSQPTMGEVNTAITQCRADTTIRNEQKVKARLIVKDADVDPKLRLNALILLMDLDK